jgi:hypothetical protein
MATGDKQLPEAWRTPAQLEKLTQDLALTEPYIVWVAVHGYLVLALSHPKTTGPSRQLIENFLLLLEGHLAAAGFPEPPSGWRSFAVVDPPPAKKLEPVQGHGSWDPHSRTWRPA